MTKPNSTAAPDKAPQKPKPTTKLELLLAKLGQPDGASIDELVAATGWQKHSVRGAMAGSLKKKGHCVISAKVDGERRYRVEPRA